MANLRVLILSSNPITTFLSSSNNDQHTSLQTLYLSKTHLNNVQFDNISIFTNLRYIDLSYGNFKQISSFKYFQLLESINLEGSLVESFPPDVFLDMHKLRHIVSSTFKLCCRQLIPAYMTQASCIAPSDEISSCDNLLRSNFYRGFLWIFSFIAIVGKGFSFSFRFFTVGIHLVGLFG